MSNDNFWSGLEVQQKQGRTTDRKSVMVYKKGTPEGEAFATKCMAGEYIFKPASKVQLEDIKYRLTVVTAIKHNGLTAPSTKPGFEGQTWEQYEIRGRDVITNASLITWIILKAEITVPEIGTMFEMPCFLLPKGEVSFANGKLTHALKDVWQAAEQGQAQELNSTRQAAFQATALSVTAKETATKVAV